MTLSRTDIELAFIRSLACSGYVLSGPQLSPEDRRERIRVAIMKSRVKDKAFPIELNMTYSEAYQMAYNQSCELRRFDRDQKGRALPPESLENPHPDDIDDLDDDESEDAAMGLL